MLNSFSISPCFHPLSSLVYGRGHATTGTLALHAVCWGEEHERTEVSLRLLAIAALAIQETALRATPIMTVLVATLKERVRLLRTAEYRAWLTINMRTHE
jgi:hypothetical protein